MRGAKEINTNAVVACNGHQRSRNSLIAATQCQHPVNYN